MHWEYLIASTVTSLAFIIGGVLWKVYPPKKINYLYGYRTRRSMSNQQIWNYANTIGAKMFLYLGISLFVLSFLAYILIPEKSPMIALFAMLVGVGIGMYWCETQLDKRFDKNGNPKETP